MPELRVAPSILSADLARLGAQVDEVLAAGATVIHFDVMDGHFVPSITVGPLVLSALREHVGPDIDIDVHLMVERPERQIADFAAAGATGITFHAEAFKQADGLFVRFGHRVRGTAADGYDLPCNGCCVLFQ